MLDALGSRRAPAIGCRWREFNAMAVAIHRGQAAKVAIRFGGWLMLAVVSISSESPATAAAPTDEVIIAAIGTAGDGYSVDEIVIDDQRRERFLAAINPAWKSLGDDWQRDTLLRLMSLRKAGKIDTKATKRGRKASAELAHVAEIAARSVIDRHPASTDTLLCDPRLREQLQAAAIAIIQQTAVSDLPATQPPDAYSIRKHLLRLRKTRHLRPELVQRVADWDRTIQSFTIDELVAALDAGKISTGAGVYLFYDPTGYLYIGEAANLQTRLSQHTSQSDRMTLDQYLRSGSKSMITIELHTFGERSPANGLAIRRAYESELIRTRQPRFNIRP